MVFRSSLSRLLTLPWIVLITACQGSVPTPPPLPAGPLYVVTIGDSQTAGYGDENVPIPHAGGYPARMIVPMIRLRPDSKVQNYGQGGWDSTQLINGNGTLLGQLPQVLKESPQPQIVCIWIGTVDLLSYNAANQEQSDLETFTKNIDSILRTLQGRGAVLAIALLDDVSKRPTVKTGEYVAGYTWRQQGTSLDADLVRMSRRAAAYNNVIRQKAREYGAVLVDLSQPGLFDDPALMSEDGLHPAAAAYDRISQIWFDALLPLLGDAQSLNLTLTATG
jgi:lysophospholipase L1-like esterase